MAEERVPTRCDQCGQTDTHPKAHVGFDPETMRTVHNDCTSVAERQLMVGSAQEAGSGPKASAILEACIDKGLKGDKLLAAIVGGKLAQAEGLHEKEASA